MAELDTLARPYAKAAFEFALHESDLESWSGSLQTAAAVTQHKQVIKLLGSPSSTSPQQASAVAEICGDAVADEGKNFITILSENKRLSLLPQISHQFEVMKAHHERAVDVELISALPIDENQRDMLTQALSEKLERKINMQVSLDKSLLGGAVIRAGDTVIDGSIRGRLTKLADSFNT
jgi:F-type H+-transporting ATPase subunit delta